MISCGIPWYQPYPGRNFGPTHISHLFRFCDKGSLNWYIFVFLHFSPPNFLADPVFIDSLTDHFPPNHQNTYTPKPWELGTWNSYTMFTTPCVSYFTSCHIRCGGNGGGGTQKSAITNINNMDNKPKNKDKLQKTPNTDISTNKEDFFHFGITKIFLNTLIT